jgi:hypothetical protein
MNSNKKENLTNKFNMAEMSVEAEVKYKYADDIYSNPVHLHPNSNKTVQFSWISTIVRFVKIAFKFFFDALSQLWSGLVKPLSLFLSHSFSRAYENAINGKNKKEIVIDEYLKKVESNIDLQETLLRMKEIEISNNFQGYESKIKKTFNEFLCNVTLNSSKEEFSRSSKSLSFGQELLEHMSSKMKEGFLLNNIDYINITSNLEKLEATYVIEMELKSNGANWASVFSKFVLSDMHKKTELYGGKVSGQHIVNVTLNRNTFILVLSHHKLEILELDLKENAIKEKKIKDFDSDLEINTSNHLVERIQDI